MDKPGLVTSTGPAPMAPSIFEECVRRAVAKAPADFAAKVSADSSIEYVLDEKLIPESKVFGTDSQKGN